MITGYNPETKTLTIGITSLISFRKLPETLVPPENPFDIRARSRLHSSYQRNLCKQGYEREVSVEYHTKLNGIDFCIRGRIDLIREQDGTLEIIEVKTLPPLTTLDIPPTPKLPHLLQLWFYALALGEDEQWVDCSFKPILTYILPETKPLKHFDTSIDLNDSTISIDWEQMLSRVALILNDEDVRRAEQLTELKHFSFPYRDFRPGQKRMIELSAECISGSSNLMLQAPTGTGKTAAILTGVIPEVLRKRLTLFFLTAKNTHMKIVRETIELMIRNGLHLRAIFLTAREKVCLSGTSSCNPDECPYAKDFASRVESYGVISKLCNESIITRDNLVEKAENAEVCPFELGLALSLRCDLVVCDYNYVFDPRVYLRRFFEEKNTSNMCTLLIDEAANLPERARGYYSPEIKLSIIEHLLNSMLDNNDFMKLLLPWVDLFKTCSALLLNEHSKEISLPDDTLIPLHTNKWKKAIQTLPNPWSDELRDFVRSVNDFIRIETDRDERFKLLLRSDGDDRILQWFCMDPSNYLGERISRCHSTMAFSATLTPFEYHRELLGFPVDFETIIEEIPWPFPTENLRVLIDSTIDTRYKQRSASAHSLALKLSNIHRKNPGTWLIFFPSYTYLESIAGILEEMHISFLCQKRVMTTAERNAFICKIETGKELILIVSGGIFSEGVDLHCDSLKGAVVISPSLPGIDLRTDLLRDFYCKSGNDGFLRTLAIPGMTRVIQAAGRLIRDRGQRRILILMGKRFTIQPYFNLLPKHWFNNGKIEILSDSYSGLIGFLNEKEEGDA